MDPKVRLQIDSIRARANQIYSGSATTWPVKAILQSCDELERLLREGEDVDPPASHEYDELGNPKRGRLGD